MLSLIEAAGWPIWFLIVTSVAAVALIIERGLALRRPKVLPDGLLDELTGLRGAVPVTPELLARLSASSPLGRVLAAGARHEAGGRARMKEAMEDTGRAVAHELEKYLSGLGTIATVAPLMGLFGTVVGMIEIFGAQAPGGTNPQQLAHGISVALYNTAFGILIAIPALIAYRHFRARVDGYLTEMEQQALRLVDLVAAEPLPAAAGETAAEAEPRKPVRRAPRPAAERAKASPAA
ncbi:MotA/TolQ/ExbB proton channel family protein [Zeimonas sediminis]|uniref:MotA/TolQ/ExbB proton channel family protein n=1 Tax=Zeimonas sediminis TaxID=2944268 RepID=UPI00300DC81B